jgi:subtilase family serine protease
VDGNRSGGSESSSDASYDLSHFNHQDVAITASSGDNGYGVEYPAASRYGCSAFDPKPSWQTDPGCGKRTVADVLAVVDPNTGVSVYDSYSFQGHSGWLVFGGTSVASPIAAARDLRRRSG